MKVLSVIGLWVSVALQGMPEPCHKEIQDLDSGNEEAYRARFDQIVSEDMALSLEAFERVVAAAFFSDAAMTYAALVQFVETSKRELFAIDEKLSSVNSALTSVVETHPAGLSTGLLHRIADSSPYKDEAGPLIAKLVDDASKNYLSSEASEKLQPLIALYQERMQLQLRLRIFAEVTLENFFHLHAFYRSEGSVFDGEREVTHREIRNLIVHFERQLIRMWLMCTNSRFQEGVRSSAEQIPIFFLNEVPASKLNPWLQRMDRLGIRVYIDTDENFRFLGQYNRGSGSLAVSFKDLAGRQSADVAQKHETVHYALDVLTEKLNDSFFHFGVFMLPERAHLESMLPGDPTDSSGYGRGLSSSELITFSIELADLRNRYIRAQTETERRTHLESIFILIFRLKVLSERLVLVMDDALSRIPAWLEADDARLVSEDELDGFSNKDLPAPGAPDNEGNTFLFSLKPRTGHPPLFQLLVKDGARQLSDQIQDAELIRLYRAFFKGYAAFETSGKPLREFDAFKTLVQRVVDLLKTRRDVYQKAFSTFSALGQVSERFMSDPENDEARLQFEKQLREFRRPEILRREPIPAPNSPERAVASEPAPPPTPRRSLVSWLTRWFR